MSFTIKTFKPNYPSTFMKSILYLDTAATSPIYSAVVAEMNNIIKNNYGNPSSIHFQGERARKLLEESRKKIALSINANPEEIYFVSGGTEANNLALQGLAIANPEKKKIIVSAIEHASVLEVCNSLKKWGYQIVKIPVDKSGTIDFNDLKREIDDNTLLVSIMHVNNEIGVIQDIEKIGAICKTHKAFFHTDAVQSFGKEKIDVKRMQLSLISASAHKIGGPKGIGFLYVNQNVKISPIIHGGGQERGIRSGTENVPSIAGFSKALELIEKTNKIKIKKIRGKLIQGLDKIGGKINGSLEKRIYNNINVSFSGIDGETAVIFLSERGIYVSTGSACSSSASKESHVLKALGLKEEEIKGSIRLTFGNSIKEKDANFIIKEIDKVVKRLRG